MPIEGLSTSRRMPRLGKIHLGYRHPQKGYPVRTDYFVLPKDHPQHTELVKLFGEQPRELRILIPVEDEDKYSSQYYRCYSLSRGLVCKGDGLTATRMVAKGTDEIAWKEAGDVEMKDMVCAGRECPIYQSKKCGEVMNLQFLLPEIPGLGVWQIDTGSINSIININSAAELIKAIYKKISMIPLLLTLEPKEVNNPDTKKKMTVYVLNLRVNVKLADLAQLARKQTETLELPVGDNEAPDFANEFEALPPLSTTVEQDIDELFPGAIDKSPPVEKPQRNLNDIKNFGDCFQAIWEDFRLTKADTLRALMVNTQADITDLPAKVYEKVAGMQ
jgi:hypothetical protein